MPVDASGLEDRLREWAAERAQECADRFGQEVQAGMPRRTGELHDSVEVGGAVVSGDRVTVSITVTAEYARYQNEGTGIYGPDGARISGNPLLAFDWPAAGGLVIVHSVAGAPGSHFWDRALEAWSGIVAAV